MSAVAFDTLKFARSLREKAKLPPEQAEGFADAIAEALQGDLATKSDLREVELRLEAKMEAIKADLIKWTLGTVGFQTLAVLGAAFAVSRGLRP